MQFTTVTAALVALTTLTGHAYGAAISARQVRDTPHPNNLTTDNRIQSSLVCCPAVNFTPQAIGDIQTEAELLIAFPATFLTTPGNCYTSINPQNAAAIVICNDVSLASLPLLRDIANFSSQQNDENGISSVDVGNLAQDIVNQCNINGMACGQAFDADGYNVIVDVYTSLPFPNIIVRGDNQVDTVTRGGSCLAEQDGKMEMR